MDTVNATPSTTGSDQIVRIRYALVTGGTALVLALGVVGCSDEKTEYVTTDTVGDCDQHDWETRTTDPESMQECAGKTGPDPELDKPHKVKVKKPKTTKTKKPGTTTKKDGDKGKSPRPGTGGGGGRGGRR